MARPNPETSNETIRHRLAALELAVALGSVAEACRRTGISRTQFYEYKRRFEAQGVEGLRDLPPTPRHHPSATPAATISRLMELSMLHPSWGCVRLAEQLAKEGTRISSPTVQKLLNQRGLGTSQERLGKLEEMAMGGGLSLSSDQVRAIERMNPAFRERHQETSQPGQLLCQDTCSLGVIPGVGPAYAQVVVDTYNNYAFGYIHTERMPEHAAVVLHHEVMPQYVRWGLKLCAIMTDRGREYCGGTTHPYQLYLSLNDVDHRISDEPRMNGNGFIERFTRSAMEEFFRPAQKMEEPWTLENLQNAFHNWLDRFNHERPLLGFPTMGKTPADTLSPFSVAPIED